MFELFVLACICALASGAKVYNRDLGCSYHVNVSYPRGMENDDFESFVVSYYLSPFVARYSKVVYSHPGMPDYNIEYMRCDDNNNGECYVKFYSPSSCNEAYKTPDYWNVLYYYQTEFEYDESLYPLDVNCPDESTGCKYYEGANGMFVVVNPEGFFVNVSYERDQSVHVIWTFFGPPSMDEFVLDKCRSSTHLSAPVDMCGSMDYILTTELDCPYHVKVEFDDGKTRDYYGAVVNGSRFYAKVVDSAYDHSVRCDTVDENGNCYLKHVNLISQTCQEDNESAQEFFLDYPAKFLFDSVNYPKPVDCPNSSTGCKLYCDDILEMNCITVDNANRIVRIGNKTYTFFQPPSLDVFDVVDCAGEHLPAPRDYCPSTSSSASNSTSSSASAPISSSAPASTSSKTPTSFNPSLSSASKAKAVLIIAGFAVTAALL